MQKDKKINLLGLEVLKVNDALLNNVLSANGIAVTNVELGYMDLFNDFFPVNLREVRAVNE